MHQVELELQNEELRRAQGALEEARDLYLDLYDFAPVGYFTLDAGGGIASINLAGAALLRVDRAALITRPFERFVVAKDQARWTAHLRSVREHGLPETCELLLRPAGGDPFAAQLTSAAAVPGSGGSSNVRCTLVDVSDRRRAEEERERRIVELVVLNQRLEQTQRQLLQADKMAAIGQLAAGVAHEINNPLCYALSNLFLLDGYVQTLFEQRRAATDQLAGDAEGKGVEPLRLQMLQSLAESREGLERVSRVVRDLGIFAHPDTGTLQVADLQEMVEGALRIVAGALGPGARVIREFGAEGLKLRCRPYQLGQVFMNLLVNAAQASPPSATIIVRTGWLGEEAWIEIEDNGTGIAPEHLGRIFEPFFTTKPIGVGTGLGLSIAHAIVRGHGGRIEVRTEVGAGSTFRVHLPVNGEVRSADPSQAVGPDRYVS